MYFVELRQIQLEHYRSYPALSLELGPGMHVFAGANAQGKTNLLEAVYLIATGRSPRTNQEGELIAWDADVAHATGEFVSDVRGPFTVEVALGRNGSGERQRSGGARKRLKVNGAPRQLADLPGLVPVVLFLVDDLEIIRGEPSRRRAFLDADLSVTSRTYAWALRQYTRVLEQRNRLLKDIREDGADPGLLLPWNAQLAAFGGRICEVRTRFVTDLHAYCQQIYGGLTSSSQRLGIAYHREWGDPVEAPLTRGDYAAMLTDALDAAMPEEIRRGSSLAGPHRDDLHLTIDGVDARQFGSQGEQRTAALALRVAEFSLLHALVGDAPVLLLDDILSELDRTRRTALLEHLAPIAQVIVTTTDVDAIGLPAHARVRQYRVSRGRIDLL